MTREEIIKVNGVIAKYMGAKYPLKGELSFPMDKYEIWLPIHGIKHIHRLNYNCSMDWLYPVYQKICQWLDSEEYLDLGLNDPYGYQEITAQFNVCCDRIGDGDPISEVYMEIVNWIKIYNEKVLKE